MAHLLLLATFAASLATVTVITEGWPHLVVGSYDSGVTPKRSL